MKDILASFKKFLLSSKRKILLTAITVLTTLIISSMISMWLSKVTYLNVPSLGTIKTLGVEAYWDSNLENKTETINWGTIWPRTVKQVTLYIRSISNIETTLHLNTTNWRPTNISEHIHLSWSYNGTSISPSETILVTLVLSASSSNSFILYVINNDVKSFSFEIIIGTYEYSG